MEQTVSDAGIMHHDISPTCRPMRERIYPDGRRRRHDYDKTNGEAPVALCGPCGSDTRVAEEVLRYEVAGLVENRSKAQAERRVMADAER